MFRPIPLFVGLRYLRAKRRNRFLSFISLISIIGICLGVIALIAIMSIMNGLQSEMSGRLVGMTSHVVVATEIDNHVDFSSLNNQVKNNIDVMASAPFVEGDALMGNGQKMSPVRIRGVDLDSEKEVTNLIGKIDYNIKSNVEFLEKEIEKLLEKLNAEIPPGEILIGVELADRLSLVVGDYVSLIVPVMAQDSAVVAPRIVKFKVRGKVTINAREYDTVLVVMNLKDANNFLKNTAAEKGVKIKLADMEKSSQVKQHLQKQLPSKFIVQDWADMHKSYYATLKIEKISMFAILLMVILVAAFNIVSTLAMGVSEKRSDIAILRTMGASGSMIFRIFLLQGGLIGFIGTLFGGIGGVFVATNIASWIDYIERFLGTQIYSSDQYYISKIPSQMHWNDVIIILSISLFISLLATIFPSWRASKTNPALALKYE
ncbi:MAG: lipoprotein-releasing ABC transporter permease subunit [Gammaproteobacteria bacterium]|nr:MAG: lipoprotein-releasing ABC transporter permease subunit [Gammaproteobacteria bacterium]